MARRDPGNPAFAPDAERVREGDATGLAVVEAGATVRVRRRTSPTPPIEQPQLRGYLGNAFESPVDHVMTLARAGDVSIDAPDERDSETTGETLANASDAAYETPR